MKNLKEIRIILKEVRTKEIVISEENGCDMPKNAKELIELSNSLQNVDFLATSDYPGKWQVEELQNQSIKYIDED